MTRTVFYKKSLLTMIYTALLLSVSLAASASYDMYLKISGVDGEARATDHPGEIDVLAWSWGMSQSGTMHAGSGIGGGKVSIQDLSITKFVDKSSPELMLYTSSGNQFPEITLTIVLRRGNESITFLKIHMAKVIVTSICLGGSGGEDRLTENVTFNFAEVDVEYYQIADDGTVVGDPIRYGWDIAKNIKK